MRHITIAQQLIVGFGLVIITLVLSLIFALSRLEAVNLLMSEVVNEDWQKAVLANESALLMNAIARQSFSLIVFEDSNAQAEIDKNRQGITDRLAQLQPLIRLPEGLYLMEEVQELRANYVNSYLQVLEELRIGNKQKAQQLMRHQAMPDLDKLLPKMYELVDLQGRILQSNGQKVDSYYYDSKMLLWAIMLLAVLGSSVLALWIVRSVTKPLGGEPVYVKQAVERIAEGDLQEAIVIKKGDQRSLMAAMARMQESLKTMLQGMADNADGTAGAA